MKIKDAREILNSKKRQKFLRKGNFSSIRNNVVDARQILKSKRNNSHNLRNSRNSRPNPVGPSVALVRKQISQIFKSKTNAPTQWKSNKNSLLSGKHVQVERSGNLTVTSKSGTTTSRIPSKRILSSNAEILVVKREEPLQRHQITEKMDIDIEDDLETTTLKDFPEIEVFPKGLNTPLKTNYQNSFLQRTPWKPNTSNAFTGEASNQTNTMVADTVSLTGSPTPAHCVLVTNLHHSVTQEDVVELFGDIGKVTNAQLIEPGTALVSYITKNEAMQAYDTYHNRLLDGQPMQCAIMQSSLSPVRSPLSSRLGEKVTHGIAKIPSSLQLTSPSSCSSSSRFQNANRPTSSKIGNRSVQFTVRMP